MLILGAFLSEPGIHVNLSSCFNIHQFLRIISKNLLLVDIFGLSAALKQQRNISSLVMCVCVCIYIYIYIYTRSTETFSAVEIVLFVKNFGVYNVLRFKTYCGKCFYPV